MYTFEGCVGANEILDVKYPDRCISFSTLMALESRAVKHDSKSNLAHTCHCQICHFICNFHILYVILAYIIVISYMNYLPYHKNHHSM